MSGAMRLGLTATPERHDGRQVDLDWLVGPVAYQMPFEQARGRTLAEFSVVRVPVHLGPDEEAAYDQYSHRCGTSSSAKGWSSPATRGRTSAANRARTRPQGWR